MSLEVKKAHLKFAFYLLAWRLRAPNLFYTNADIVELFFTRMDENATYGIIAQTKNPDAKPCYFGEIIIYTAENGFDVAGKSDPTEGAVLKRFCRDIFLNVAAWYICPLLEANKRQWPYMPQSWVGAYVEKIKNLKRDNPNEYRKYLDNIFDFIKGAEEKWWIYPYENILTQIGEKSQENILIFIGMFLQAREEQKKESAKNIELNLSSEVIKFIEGIEGIENIGEIKDPPPI